MKTEWKRIAGRFAKTAALLCGVVVAISGCGETEPQKGPAQVAPKAEKPTDEAPAVAKGPYIEALAQFNRGAALMEQYQYSEAAKAFQRVLELAPDWNAARFNLGLAYFNMHGQRGAQKNLDTARDVFAAVVASDPDHLPARFCLGLYYQHLGENEEAIEYFQAVHEADRTDPHAAYKYAEVLASLERHEEATKTLEGVVAVDGGFVSAVYRLALQYQRGGQPEKARPLFERFKELNAAELSGGTFVVQKVYGTVGKYYQVLGADNLPLPSPESAPSRRVVFAPKTKPLDTAATSWKWSGGSIALPGIATADVDGDGDLDLCLTAMGEQGSTSIWLNDGRGEFSPGPPIAQRGVSPCFGDVDNDGDCDLWLGRAGPDAVFVNDGAGKFQSGTFDAIAGPDALTAAARLVDVDSDGDLDFLAFRLAGGSVPAAGESTPAPCSVWNNNRDGSFADVAKPLGLALEKTPVAAVVYDDFDNDRDLDFVLFPAGDGPPIAWVNDRVGRYRILDAEVTGLVVSDVISATTGDPDKDGDRDLLVLTAKGMRLLVNTGTFRFREHESFSKRHGRLSATGGQFVDVDNDGDLDIILPDAHRRDGSRGPALLINDRPRDRFLNAAQSDPGNLLGAIRTKGNAACVAADFTGNGRCDIFLAPLSEKPFLIENVTPGGHWIELDLAGKLRQDNKARSNRSAIGARVEIKTGTVFQQFVVGGCSGPSAMPPLRIHAGLGDNPKVQWLRILWPDAVLQAELELPADRVSKVTELPRKTSSCPYLFAWNGERFEFVADFGGVGGLGYFVAPGQYAPPDPTEYLRIPQLQARDGQYVLQTVTPLEEVTYFDEAKLIAVDHPPGTEVYPHEMMAINVPPPPFEVFCIGKPIEPVAAVDHRGMDVADRIRRIDRRCAGATDPDGRFTGLAGEHFVELDFGGRLQKISPEARLVLFLHGWVEYGYSSTNYAAAQAGMRTEAPTIHALRDGRWVELFKEAGYPAGVNHMMTLDVTGKILPGDRRIRISSNMELYWDRIFLGEHLAGAAVSIKEVAAGRADLHYLGYPREYSPDGHHPNLCDYDNVDRTAPWKLMSGRYTRYGEVAELLEEADDCFAIMGHGDEITLSFPADAFGPVPAGRRRTFLLKTDSFCKDMDLYTAHGDTVGPLPFHAMSGYPYGPDEHYPDNAKTRNYRQRYNTRHVRTR